MVVGLALSVGFLIVVLNFALRARRQPVVSGREQMLGATGEIVDDAAGAQLARIHGEMWKVRASSAALARGQKVRVTGIDGLVLSVEPATNEGELK